MKVPPGFWVCSISMGSGGRMGRGRPAAGSTVTTLLSPCRGRFAPSLEIILVPLDPVLHPCFIPHPSINPTLIGLHDMNSFYIIVQSVFFRLKYEIVYRMISSRGFGWGLRGVFFLWGSTFPSLCLPICPSETQAGCFLFFSPLSTKPLEVSQFLSQGPQTLIYVYFSYYSFLRSSFYSSSHFIYFLWVIYFRSFFLHSFGHTVSHPCTPS